MTQLAAPPYIIVWIDQLNFEGGDEEALAGRGDDNEKKDVERGTIMSSLGGMFSIKYPSVLTAYIFYGISTIFALTRLFTPLPQKSNYIPKETLFG